jgi:biotin carboxyl carrier protein
VKITLDGVTREVTVERSGDGFAVTVDGRRHEVSGAGHDRGVLTYLSGTDARVAHVSRSARGIELTIRGRTHVRARDDADADRPVGAASGGDGRVTAPMPGAIMAVNVAVGESVKSGQPLVVLESMKMHNEIVSPIGGTVQSLSCREGEQVSFGQVLVEITAE